MKEMWFGREEYRIILIVEETDCKSTEERNKKIFLTLVEILLSAKKMYNPFAIYYISIPSHVLSSRAA